MVDSEEEAPVGNAEFEGCEYCRLRGRGKFKLYPGSIFLYFKDGRLRVLADIDHVYHKCREGLKENIVFLYRMFKDLRSIGFDVAVVSKAYDDDLYAYVRGSVKEREVEYYGLCVGVIGMSSSIEEFEKMNWYMEMVDDDIVLEAIGVEHPEHSIEDEER